MLQGWIPPPPLRIHTLISFHLFHQTKLLTRKRQPRPVDWNHPFGAPPQRTLTLRVCVSKGHNSTDNIYLLRSNWLKGRLIDYNWSLSRESLKLITQSADFIFRSSRRNWGSIKTLMTAITVLFWKLCRPTSTLYKTLNCRLIRSFVNFKC